MDEKKDNELAMANNILSIVSNLSDEEEAIEYARLYLKAQKEAIAGEEHSLDEEEVYRLIAETDIRFEEWRAWHYIRTEGAII